MNRIQKVKSANLPVGNYAYGVMGQQYGTVGYQGVQGMPMQGMVGMPVMGYPQMQPVQGYAMPAGYVYNTGYYK